MIQKNITHRRGDTESMLVELDNTSFEDIEEIRFTLKDKLNSAAILELVYPAHVYAWSRVGDELTLTLNHGDSPKHTRTNYFYVPDSGKREFEYDFQLMRKDPKRRFSTLYAGRFILVGDVTNFDGEEVISHFLEAETYENSMIEGPLLAVIASWANASNPSATNPIATLEDLKKINSIKSNVEIEIVNVSPEEATARAVTLKKKREENTPVLMFIGGVQTPVPQEQYTVIENNVVSWSEEHTGGWLADKVTENFTLMFIYYSDIFEELANV